MLDVRLGLRVCSGTILSNIVLFLYTTLPTGMDDVNLVAELGVVRASTASNLLELMVSIIACVGNEDKYFSLSKGRTVLTVLKTPSIIVLLPLDS